MTKSETYVDFQVKPYICPKFSAAYMRQWTESSLLQVMACRLFGAKPLPEPALAYCKLDSREQISVNGKNILVHQ